MLTPRIEQLKKQFFTHVPAVCLEGALSKTHVFKETEGEPMIVRRAKAFKRHCETKTITIQPGELIVGNAGRTARTIHICPELSNNWVYEELDTMATRPQDPYAITEEQKMLFRNEIYPYWKGKTLRDYWNAQAPKPILDIISVGGVIDNDIKIECAPGETTPEFPDHLLPKGFKGIQDEAQALLDAVDLTVPANYEKRDFWQAAVIVNEGLRILCRRHAEAAEALAARESDPIRKAELLNIASDCASLTDNPPATFRQALQQIHGPGALLPVQAPGQQARPGIGHVMQHAQMREQGVILEHVADAPPPGRHTDALLAVIQDVPVHHDAPGIGPDQTGKAMQGQGLARTGSAEQNEGPAVLRHLQTDAQMEGRFPAGIVE